MANIEPVQHRIAVSGRGPVPIELFRGYQFHRADLRTTHEEADVTMVHQVLHLENGAQTIKVVSDDTDVFVLLVHFCELMKLKCSLIMEATHSERWSIDIHVTVKKNQDIVSKL